LDTLVGCFGIGLTPTGSADPFALRRAALGLIRIGLDARVDLRLRSLLEAAHASYPAGVLKPVDEVVGALLEFVRGRLKSYYGERFPTDLVEACLAAWDGEDMRDLGQRLDALDTFRQGDAYESLAVAFKRTFNIAKDAPTGDVDAGLLVEAAEK